MRGWFSMPYTRSRTQLPDWSREHNDEIASLRYWQLHWLPVRRRVNFKVQASRPGLQCIHGLASIYLSEDCRLMTSDSFRCRLRSAEVDTCLVPRTQLWSQFCCRRSTAAVEQISGYFTPFRHRTCWIQTTTENCLGLLKRHYSDQCRNTIHYDKKIV